MPNAPLASKSTAAHTPGPWDAYIVANGFAVYQTDGAGNGDAIRCIPGDDESGANARLIAAAPDLLSALKGLLNYNDLPHGAGSLRYARHLAEQVIAKAEGR